MNGAPRSQPQPQPLALRHQALLELAQQERAALLRASAGLRQPLRSIERLAPWLALGWRLSRLWRQRKT
jgi:hypothetical protein